MCNTYIVACVVVVCSYVVFSRLYSKPIADFILCYITMPRYLCCFIKEEELPACRPRPLKGHHKAGGQKLYKIAVSVGASETRAKKKNAMVLKRRVNLYDGKMVEPHCSHFLVLFFLRLSLRVSSTYILQRRMKGREGRRYRETSVGSYCVSMIAPSLLSRLSNKTLHNMHSVYVFA